MNRHQNPAAVIDIAVRQMGSIAAVANALQVDRATVNKWRNGTHALKGTGLVALMALIRHPEDFQQYKRED